MKRMFRQWVSLALIAALLVSLFPPKTALAASFAIEGFQYTGDTPPGDDVPVDQITTNPLSFTALISDDFTDADLRSMYVQVYNHTTGRLQDTDASNNPVRNPDNPNQLLFNNIHLTSGLNKITVKMGNSMTFPSVWVRFVASTNISNLKINNEPLEDVSYPFNGTGMLPKQQSSQVTITGNAANANYIRSMLLGNQYNAGNYVNGRFTFFANTGRSNDMTFVPGDNEVTFVSHNNTNRTELTKHFVYDNGKAFAFNAKVGVLGDTNGQVMYRADKPTITAADKNITLTGYLKSSKSNNGTTLDYSYADFTVSGTGQTVRYSFADNDFVYNQSGTVTSPAYLHGGGTANNSQVSKYDSPDNRYTVHEVKVDLPINGGARAQSIEVKFIPSDDSREPEISRFSFNYVNTNEPYIQKVERVVTTGTGEILIPLNERGATQINEMPALLQVTAPNATHIRVKVNGTVKADYAAGSRIELSGLPDGDTDLELIPIRGTDVYPGTIFKLLISGSPYLVANNIYDNMQVCGTYNCGTNTLPQVITGSVFNVPSDFNASFVSWTVNGKVPDDPTVLSFTGKNFELDPAAVRVDGKQVFNEEGQKTLSFTLRVGSIVTKTDYDIFVFKTNLPVISDFSLSYPSRDPNYNKVSDTEYVTTSNRITLKGSVVNASSANIKLYYQAPGESTVRELSPSFSGSDPVTFTHDFDLQNYGDYIFELRASAGGSTVVKTIKVTKEEQAYRIIRPAVIKNTNGIDQANINKNFENVQIVADRASYILYNKVQYTAIGKTSDNQDLFEIPVTDLKTGNNRVKFTIVRGDTELDAEIILNNVNNPIEGAQFKTPFKNKMTAFNKEVELSFPKDTKLMRNDRENQNQYVSDTRSILFGIATNTDGIVDKNEEDVRYGGQQELLEPTGRFRPASKRYWIDAGTIADINKSPSHPDFEKEMRDALFGSGRLPYEPPKYGNAGGGEFFTRQLKDMVVPTKRGKLTLKYDDSIRAEAWKYLTVFHYSIFPDSTGDPNRPGESEWRILGGVVNTKNHTIEVPFYSFGYYQVMYMDNSFNDFANHPQENALNIVYSKGIMHKMDSETTLFRVNNPVTRGEFVSMLVRIFDIPLENEDTFVNDPDNRNYNGSFLDVQRGEELYNNNGLYDFQHIEAAARVGIIRGEVNSYFNHDSPIKRQDAAVMIARAAELKTSSDLSKSTAALTKQFTDGASIDDYAKPAVEAATKAGYINGKQNVLLQGQKKATYRFEPHGTLNRAEAAEIALALMQKLGKAQK